jgi:F0F1-type ATP synthase membrane subunit c/vacuolar-type H+-ATPase subunit K
MNEIKSKLRKVRLIQVALIAAIAIFGWVAEFDRRPGGNDWTFRHWLVTGLALWGASAGFRLRHRLIILSEGLLAQDPSNPKGLKKWEAGNVISLGVAESVAMWGLIVRMVLGGALWQASLFYLASLLLLLLWTPRMPTTARSS